MPLVKVFTTKELENSLTNAGFEIDHQWQPGKSKAVFIVAKKLDRSDLSSSVTCPELEYKSRRGDPTPWPLHLGRYGSTPAFHLPASECLQLARFRLGWTHL